MLDQEDEVISLWVDDKENQAIFTFSNGEIVTRLIDGEFPDYTKIIPTDQGDKVEIDREELERAVKLTSVFARESANIVRFRFGKKLLTVEANAAEIGKGSSEIEIDYQGEEVQIAFNFRFLADVLKAVTTDQILMNIKDSIKPGVFSQKGNENFLHLIMPVRVQDTER